MKVIIKKRQARINTKCCRDVGCLHILSDREESIGRKTKGIYHGAAVKLSWQFLLAIAVL